MKNWIDLFLLDNLAKTFKNLNHFAKLKTVLFRYKKHNFRVSSALGEDRYFQHKNIFKTTHTVLKI